jgi:hypothetical protein
MPSDALRTVARIPCYSAENCRHWPTVFAGTKERNLYRLICLKITPTWGHCCTCNHIIGTRMRLDSSAFLADIKGALCFVFFMPKR